MRTTYVFVDRARRFSLDRDEESERTFVSIPVRSQTAEYGEWYEIDAGTFSAYRADP
jgi:hypothetical protein